MKNRLQFNRHYAEYPSREAAKTAFRTRLTDPDFVPLIGEPVVLRYRDAEDNLQLILAIGKKAGRSLEERDYHYIDTAELDEKLAEQLTALETLDAETIKGVLFNGQEAVITDGIAELSVSANTIPVGEDYETHVIPENPEGRPHPIHRSYSTTDAIKQLDINALDIANRIDALSADTVAADEVLNNAIATSNLMLNGRCQSIQDQLDDEKEYRKAIKLVKLTNGQIVEQFGPDTNIKDAYFLTRHMPGTTEPYTDPQPGDVIIKVYDPQYSLALDAENAIISLNWIDEEGQERSSNINVADFTKDSFLTGVQVVTVSDPTSPYIGQECIEFSFRTYDGQPVPIYIPLTHLATIYHAGDGIEIENVNGQYVITAKIDPMHEGENSWLAKEPNGLRVTGLTEYVDDQIQAALSGLDLSDYVKKSEVEDHLDSASTLPVQNKVVTKALNDLSDSVDERITSALTEISGIVETYVEEKLSGLNFDEIYEYVDNSVSALSGDILTYVIDNEEVTAAALNDLNERVSTVETHMNGEYIYLTGYEEASDLTEDELIISEEDTVNSAFGKIQKQIIDDEEVISASLNDLNRRVLENAQAIAQNTGVTALSGAVLSLSAATHNKFENLEFNLSSAFTNVNNSINILSGVVEEISGLTDGVLTIKLNGVEQGKYSPSADTMISLTAITEVTGADVLLTGYELSSGRTEEELAIVPTDTVNEAFGKIQKQFYDNEAVVANAINDLNDRVDAVSGSVEDIYRLIENMGSGSSVNIANLSAATVALSAATTAISTELADCFDGAEYISSAKTIIFMHGGVVKDSIDATAFIKDGMVDNVVVDVPTAGAHSGETCLIITFNTDSGKEEIDIPVSEIFDPATLNELSASVVANEAKLTTISGDVIALSATVIGNVANFNELSASVVTNRENIESLSADIIDNEYVIAAALNDLNSRVWELSGRTVDLSNYYTKDEVYNKEEVDRKIASGGTFDPTQYYTTANTYNKTEVNNLLSSLTNVYSSSTAVSAQTSLSAITSFSAKTSTSAQTSLSAITSLSAQTSISARTSVSAQTSLSAITSLSAQTCLSAMTAKNLDLRYVTGNSLSGINFSEFLTIINTGANGTLSIATTGLPVLPANGVREGHVLINNTSSTDAIVITLASDSRVKMTNGDKIAIDPNGIGELNAYITYNGSAYTIYVITS